MANSNKSTNYADTMLRDTARTVYEVETTTSQHYEKMRSLLTQFNLLATGALSGLAGVKVSYSQWALIMLFFLCLAMGLFAWQVSKVHAYHWHLASKMRRILLRATPKAMEKYEYVNTEYNPDILGMNTDHFWIFANILIPLAGATALSARILLP
ncbi:MAG: hypothetical protein AAF299_09895 [Pseudomonadota bacterium]